MRWKLKVCLGRNMQFLPHGNRFLHSLFFYWRQQKPLLEQCWLVNHLKFVVRYLLLHLGCYETSQNLFASLFEFNQRTKVVALNKERNFYFWFFLQHSCCSRNFVGRILNDWKIQNEFPVMVIWFSICGRLYVNLRKLVSMLLGHVPPHGGVLVAQHQPK
jgi:hypothetical protein